MDTLKKHSGTLHRLAWHRLRYDRAAEAEPLYRLLALLEPDAFAPRAGLAYALLLQSGGRDLDEQMSRLRALATLPAERRALARLERRRSRLADAPATF